MLNNTKKNDELLKEREETISAIIDSLRNSDIAVLRYTYSFKSSVAQTCFSPTEIERIEEAISYRSANRPLCLLRMISNISTLISGEIDRITAESVPSVIRTILSIPSAPSWLIPWLPLDTDYIFLLSAGSQIRYILDPSGIVSLYSTAKFPFTCTHVLAESLITALENPDNPTQAILMRAANVAVGYIERTTTPVADYIESLNVKSNNNQDPERS